MIVGDRVEIDGTIYEVRYWNAFKKAWCLRDKEGNCIEVEEKND